MKEERNRVIEGMKAWKEKERAIADLFSSGAVKTEYFQKAKLNYLYELRSSLGGFVNKQEKMMLRILRGEIDRLEKWLYPNLLIRSVVQLIRMINVVFKTKNDISDPSRFVSKPYTHIEKGKPVNKNDKEMKLETRSALNLKQNHTLLEKKRTGLQKGVGL